MRELLTDTRSRCAGPTSLAPRARHPRLRREVHAVRRQGARKGLDDRRACRARRGTRAPERRAGLFLEQYLDDLDAQGATDYTDLVRRAALAAEVHRDELRDRLRHVFVDEYQDTDPGQVALLRGAGRRRARPVVVGDPHQSIYAFRGAEVRGILDFPTASRRRRPARPTSWRCAPPAASARGC